VKEPQREEGAAELAPPEQEVGQPPFVAEPKAYAFDGWGMVPLELDPV
jgi:hypothetical protein